MSARSDRGATSEGLLSRETPRRERGAISAPVAIAIGVVLLIPMLFSALLGSGITSPANACGQATTPQPAAARTTAEIPPNYLRLYQATGQRYGIPWNLLAAIGQTESDHGRDPAPGVKTGQNWAGAAGPMQIGVGGLAGNNWGGAPRHPATEKTGGVAVDGDGDGWADVHNPADAIPGAARFLLAHGAPADLPKAVFAYNPDPRYVETVLTRAGRYAVRAPQPMMDTGADPEACPGDVGAFSGISGGVAATVIAYARAQVGKPYVYGGVGPDYFDCSGLTMMAYRAARITIPRLSDAQYWHGKRIREGTEQPGDLVFFNYLPGHSGPSHVGIVYNSTTGIMIVAPHTGDIIKYQNYKSYPGGPAGFTRPAAR